MFSSQEYPLKERLGSITAAPKKTAQLQLPYFLKSGLLETCWLLLQHGLGWSRAIDSPECFLDSFPAEVFREDCQSACYMCCTLFPPIGRCPSTYPL